MLQVTNKFEQSDIFQNFQSHKTEPLQGCLDKDQPNMKQLNKSVFFSRRGFSKFNSCSNFLGLTLILCCSVYQYQHIDSAEGGTGQLQYLFNRMAQKKKNCEN